MVTTNPQVARRIVWDFSADMIRYGPFSDSEVGTHRLVITLENQAGDVRTMFKIVTIYAPDAF